MGAPDRYEPLPSLPEIPGWLWRRTGRAARVGIGVALLVVIAALAVLLPRIGDAKRDASARVAQERARAQAQLTRELEAEQRPILRRGAPAPAGAPRATQLESRAELLGAIEAAIAADARARVRRGALKGPIRRVECERFPQRKGALGADKNLKLARGRYSCLAVTAEFQGGLLGHQYRAAVDFRTGRYGFCKITGRAGPEREQIVTIPAACGGDSYR
jgi:hypothetical protein